jgi:hypothetical protein
MRETLQNAALHRLDPHGAAGFINGSSSTTWGVASVDLPVLYGSGLARLPPAIVASDGCRLLPASFGCLWLVLVVVPRVGQLGGAGERLGPHRALVLYENLRYWVPQGCNTSIRDVIDTRPPGGSSSELSTPPDGTNYIQSGVVTTMKRG